MDVAIQFCHPERSEWVLTNVFKILHCVQNDKTLDCHATLAMTEWLAHALQSKHEPLQPRSLSGLMTKPLKESELITKWLAVCERKYG
jgi:hypothetical protein